MMKGKRVAGCWFPLRRGFAGHVLVVGLSSVLCPLSSESADVVAAYRPGVAVTATNWPTLAHDTFTGTTSWAVGNIVSNKLVDFSPERDDLTLISPAVVLDGAGDKFTFDDIPVGAGISSHGGTATLTLNTGTDEITSTAGTCWDLVITNASGTWADLPLQESSGADGYDVSGNTNNATLVAAGSSIETMRGGTQSASHYNPEEGCSKVLSFNGVDAYDDLGFIPLDTTEIEIKFRLTDLAANSTFGCYGNGVTQSPRFYVYYSATSDTLSFYCGGATSVIALPAGSVDAEYHTFRMSYADGLYIDDDFIGKNTATLAGLSPNYSIGRRNLNDASYSYAKMDVVFVKRKESGVLVKTWSSASAYGTDMSGATLVNTEFLYLPTLSDGSDDVAGLGITNPGGLAHNNGPQSLVIGATTNTYANLLTNSVNIMTNSAGLITEIYE